MIRDGLSQTALASEKLHGHAARDWFSPSRDMLVVPPVHEPHYGDRYGESCREQRIVLGFFTYSGLSWMIGNATHIGYSAGLPPNSRWPDCIRSKANPVPRLALMAARSNHPGTVHVLYCDGSVAAVASTVDPRVWSALHSRAGGELVTAP